MKIWFDITNTPHVNVLLPIFKHIAAGNELLISARNFSETLPLLKKNDIHPIIVGNHKGKNKVKKVSGLIIRAIELQRKIPYYDVSFSLGGSYTSILSKLRIKPSIMFSDNDISFKDPACRFGSCFIFPSCFDTEYLIKKYHISTENIYKFDGFKEDIYIADYKPDTNFANQLPFTDFITIRPENLKASYVPTNSRTIVPDLFEVFKNENILFLPRYPEERKYAKGYNNIFIPEQPLNGLDVCYYSIAMLTGAGTFAREASLLGTPSVSFFPGKKFLSVDKVMQQKGLQFKSRNPSDIYNYVKSSRKRPFCSERSLKVQQEVFSIIDTILYSLDT